MTEGLNNPLVSYDVYDRLDALGVAIPKPAVTMPAGETTGGSAGTDDSKYAQQGHSHPRLTSSTKTVLTTDGTATVTFTRTFSAQPCVVLTEVNATSNQPLVLVVQSFIMTNGLYSGCVLRGYRSNQLPTLGQISVTSLLASVITGINAIASALTGFNVFGGSAVGAQVSVVAIASSEV